MQEPNWKRRLLSAEWVDDRSQELFFEFARDAYKHQIGDRRIDKYQSDLFSLHSITGISIFDMVKSMSALESVCLKVNQSKEYETATKRDAKRTLGSLYNFLHNKERSLKYADRKLKEAIAHKTKASDKRIAKAVITREEIRELSKYGDTIDKAIIWLLFESGMRNGEFEQLKKSDITPMDEGLNVRVPAGKTGEREVVVVEACSYVLKWIDEHPEKSKDAPLWQSIDTGNALAQAGIANRIRQMKDRLNATRAKKGIPKFTKNVNPHNFRHSRASELGAEPGMTEAIMCKFFGWELDSDMPRTYIHLTNEQVRRAVLRTYGKAKPEDDKKVITSWICPRCKIENPLALNYCGNCGTGKEGKVISKVVLLEGQIADMKDKQDRMIKLLVKSGLAELEDFVERKKKEQAEKPK